MLRLIVERPNESLEYASWDKWTQRRFLLDSDEIELVNKGEIVWRGDMALHLEDE